MTHASKRTGTPPPSAITPDDLPELARAKAYAFSGKGRSVRIAAGLSVYRMAKALGIYPQTIGRWEKGERKPSGKEAVAWARALGRLEEALGGVMRREVEQVAVEKQGRSVSPGDREVLSG